MPYFIENIFLYPVISLLLLNDPYLEQAEHIATSFGNGRHLRDDWEIMYDKGNLILLNSREVLGVSEEPVSATKQ